MLIVFGYVVMGHTLDIVSESEEIIEDESTMEEIEYETLVAMENENQIVNWANEDKCDIMLLERMINDVTFNHQLQTAPPKGLYLEEIFYES